MKKKHPALNHVTSWRELQFIVDVATIKGQLILSNICFAQESKLSWLQFTCWNVLLLLFFAHIPPTIYHETIKFPLSRPFVSSFSFTS